MKSLIDTHSAVESMKKDINPARRVGVVFTEEVRTLLSLKR